MLAARKLAGVFASGTTATFPVSAFSWRRDGVACIALALISFVIFNANMRAISAIDTYAARYLPLSIWRNHTLVLDPIVTEVAQGRNVARQVPEFTANALWIQKGRDDQFVSLYPVATPLAIAPLYLPAVLYLDATGWDPQRVDLVARVMEKLAASLLAAASVALLYLVLRRRTEQPTAILLSVVYAFGTTTWVISSQALWVHGLGQLLVVAALWFLTGPSTAARCAAAGLLCALIACNRPPDAVLAMGLGLYGIWWSGRKVAVFLAAGAVPVGLLLAYNLAYVGNAFGAYALIGGDSLRLFFDSSPIEGFFGLLFSPTRGLFVFSPFLLFLLPYLPLVFRDRNARILAAIGAGAVLLQVVGYAFGDWRQGMSWGPRWLTDMLPILMWMLPPVIAGLRTGGRAVFGMACCVAIAIQAVGAFWYTGASDAPFLGGEGPDKMHAAWDVGNAPFIASLLRPPAPADLLVGMRGHIDTAQVVATGPDDNSPQVVVEGWALADSDTPADVAIRIDGRDVAGTGDFFDRVDVVEALGEKSPSGWRLAVPADQFAPGEHTVAAMVRVRAGGGTRLLMQRNFTVDVEAAGLAGASRRAAEWIAARQQPLGYWLTDFTSRTSFDAVREEMNTYTQAIMIDTAAPIAARAGLAGALDRARTFLTSQIEDGGLVRYHGRPDSPTIGILGCAITPDSDDTALAWTTAPGADPDELQAALATMNQYRTADGLYRTWLAPRDGYACLDPGSDPNPADIGIQVNVLLLLAQADPAAARALCAALRPRVDDESVWVYYKVAPAIVALRWTELEKIGCALELPSRRLQTGIAGQELWMEAIKLLQRLEADKGNEASVADARSLLQKLAADDFSLLRGAPPVIYHNDLTATVSRYYWSRDVGFALWLRLYFASLQAQAAPCEQSSGQCGGT